MSGQLQGERLVIAHLFPELLGLYGDRGNVETLVQRAAWRGADVEVVAVRPDDTRLPADTDVVFLGGGQDREQVAVAASLVRLGDAVREAVADGASLLAVCGGYQNVGHVYHSPWVGDLVGPGLLNVWTEAPPEAPRLVGNAVIELPADSPIVTGGVAGAALAGVGSAAQTLVGFENHSGRTYLGPGVHPLGIVRAGYGNNGHDELEGAIALPGESGMAGLRIGTYLHGPLLPQNPHLADFVLASAVARRGVSCLDPLPDGWEWRTHALFERRFSGGGASSSAQRRSRWSNALRLLHDLGNS